MPLPPPKLLSCDENDVDQFLSEDENPLCDPNPSLEIQNDFALPPQEPLPMPSDEETGAPASFNLSDDHHLHSVIEETHQTLEQYMDYTIQGSSFTQSSNEDPNFHEAHLQNKAYTRTTSTDFACSKVLEDEVILDNEVKELYADQQRQSANNALNSMN
ncbi:hypothetical protein BWQ96_04028 [Gracilariopsis chorda]|uniref:Uncharacterized protein n=1 Tax=Gracilariopsis chorda TaxID=448386 RepID=A0A2V3IVL0_9FLOR|nr:hypothetical protein BWQ96_04028 [Gracilariopsis chorda]|eukprot:PXF46151.1 hypothetical protein BWQ96_04028 [Gracilariopsis chorda]